MSLENKIREAIKKSLREDASYDSTTQPNLYELNNFLRKSGYKLSEVISQKDKEVPELIILPIKESYLYPEISHDIEEGEFYIKVVEHGLLVASDVEEIIKGYTTAIGVVEHLESLDLTKLELSDEE